MARRWDDDQLFCPYGHLRINCQKVEIRPAIGKGFRYICRINKAKTERESQNRQAQRRAYQRSRREQREMQTREQRRAEHLAHMDELRRLAMVRDLRGEPEIDEWSLDQIRHSRHVVLPAPVILDPEVRRRNNMATSAERLAAIAAEYPAHSPRAAQPKRRVLGTVDGRRMG